VSYGRVQNRQDEFVLASLESITAAASHSSRSNYDFEGSLVDGPAQAALGYLALPKDILKKDA
jgi:hypothetical protein